MAKDRMWWGYVHTSGSIQVKPYFIPLDIEEAERSPFCKKVYGPFIAKNRSVAIDCIEELVKNEEDI